MFEQIWTNVCVGSELNWITLHSVSAASMYKLQTSNGPTFSVLLNLIFICEFGVVS